MQTQLTAPRRPPLAQISDRLIAALVHQADRDAYVAARAQRVRREPSLRRTAAEAKSC